MLENFKVDFLKKGSVKTFDSSDKRSRIHSSYMDIWWFRGRIFFLMSYFVGDCGLFHKKASEYTASETKCKIILLIFI